MIASRRSDVDGLETLQERGNANGLQGIERLGPAGIKEIEPLADGVAALLVPATGVVDYFAVAASIASIPEIDVWTLQHVRTIAATSSAIAVVTDSSHHSARLVVNCAGLYADRVAQMTGLDPEYRIVPFRGEYFTLAAPLAESVRSMIYPVPDPRFPFLGVHFTRRIDGAVEVGPNAVLAFGREHYRSSRANWREAAETLTYPGMQRLALQHSRAGLAEMARSRLKVLYARAARRLVPSITAGDLTPGGSGVRAQAVGVDGRLADDFVFMYGPRSLHVLNAPSPAATAALAIGRTVAARAMSVLDSELIRVGAPPG